MIFAGEEFLDQMDGPIGQKQVDPVNYERKSQDWRTRVFNYVANLVKLRTTCPALADDETEFIHWDFSNGRRIMAWTRGKDKNDKAKKYLHICWFRILCYHATTMARACEITGKSTQIGGRYSNRTRATQFNPTGKVRRKANLQRRRIYVAEIGKTVIVDVSVKGLKTIKKNGAFAALKKAKVI